MEPTRNATSPSTSQHPVGPQNLDLGKSIDAIDNAVRELPSLGTKNSPQQLDAIGRVGNLIDRAYNGARAELMASVRSRESTSVGR